MGLEAQCRCRSPAGEVEVKALLETHELILRQGVRRRIPFAEMTDVAAVGAELQITAGGETVVLVLGATVAERWHKKLTGTPPSLREKLGIDGHAVLLIGSSEDGVIEAALDGAVTAEATAATIAIAVVESKSDLGAALAQISQGTPLWVVHRKGRTATFGEMAVRNDMRAVGYIDTKVSAVSPTYSATRYAWRSHS